MMIQALLTAKQANLLKQGWRFLRVFAAVFVPQVVGIDGPITRAAVIALVPAAVEVAYRQWRPVASAPTPAQVIARGRPQ